MSGRMTDERLAEIERAVFDLEGWPVNCSKELLQALKAERQEVERLRYDFHTLRNQAEAAERKLARLVDGLDPVHKAEILAALDEDDSLTFVSHDELCVKLDEATGEGK